MKQVSAQVESKPSEAASSYSMHAFGAQFVEVRVNPDLGMVRVSRRLGIFGAGRILNPKTAPYSLGESLTRLQMMGGIVWGISQALHEETHIDDYYNAIVLAKKITYYYSAIVLAKKSTGK